jgi:hypothetical protein
MPNDDATVRRTVQLRFTAPAVDPGQLLSVLKATEPFLGLFGARQVRLLQNVDDPGRFIQIIEYETAGALELNRQQIASDARVQTYLQAWRAFMPGAVEVDVYRDLAE